MISNTHNVTALALAEYSEFWWNVEKYIIERELI